MKIYFLIKNLRTRTIVRIMNYTITVRGKDMKTTEYDYNLEKRRVIFLIDSKSFYASVESVQRGLNLARKMMNGLVKIV